MINLWYFIPKAGIAFIIFSVVFIFIWLKYSHLLDHPLIDIFLAESILFAFCFMFADQEGERKLKK